MSNALISTRREHDECILTTRREHLGRKAMKKKAINNARIRHKKYVIDTSKPPPNIPDLFTDLQLILSVEISRIKELCLKAELSPNDSLKVQRYISSICEIGRLQVHKKLQEDLRSLSDSDLESELHRLGVFKESPTLEGQKDDKRTKRNLTKIIGRVG